MSGVCIAAHRGAGRHRGNGDSIDDLKLVGEEGVHYTIYSSFVLNDISPMKMFSDLLYPGSLIFGAPVCICETIKKTIKNVK